MGIGGGKKGGGIEEVTNVAKPLMDKVGGIAKMGGEGGGPTEMISGMGGPGGGKGGNPMEAVKGVMPQAEQAMGPVKGMMNMKPEGPKPGGPKPEEPKPEEKQKLGM